VDPNQTSYFYGGFVHHPWDSEQKFSGEYHNAILVIKTDIIMTLHIHIKNPFGRWLLFLMTVIYLYQVVWPPHHTSSALKQFAKSFTQNLFNLRRYETVRWPSVEKIIIINIIITII